MEPEIDDNDPLAVSDTPASRKCKKCNCVTKKTVKNQSKMKHKIEYYKKLEDNLKMNCIKLEKEIKKPKGKLTGEALKRDYIIRCDVAFPSPTTSEFVKAQLMEKTDTKFSKAYQEFSEEFFNKGQEAYEFMSEHFRFPKINQ